VYEGDPGTATVPFTRIDPQYGNLNYRSSRGFSRYNGLNVSLKSRNLFNTGLQFNTNYTWSHAIDNLSSTFSENSGNQNLGYLDPFNPGLDKGDSEFDVRHRFVASAIWDVPWLKNAANPWVRQTFGGWSVAPIFNARTGTPYTIYDCTNAAFARCPRMVPNAPITGTTGNAGSAPVAGQANLFTWYTIPASTPYADTLTGTGEFPNCTGLKGVGCAWPSNMTGRDMFRAPGWWNTDLGIYKHFKVTERVGLQVRGEMYNLFNHPNLVIDGANNDVSGTSTIQAKKYGTRNVQLGAKVTF
jgi:hypothetical protein